MIHGVTAVYLSGATYLTGSASPFDSKATCLSHMSSPGWRRWCNLLERTNALAHAKSDTYTEQTIPFHYENG